MSVLAPGPGAGTLQPQQAVVLPILVSSPCHTDKQHKTLPQTKTPNALSSAAGGMKQACYLGRDGEAEQTQSSRTEAACATPGAEPGGCRQSSHQVRPECVIHQWSPRSCATEVSILETSERNPVLRRCQVPGGHTRQSLRRGTHTENVPEEGHKAQRGTPAICPRCTADSTVLEGSVCLCKPHQEFPHHLQWKSK